MPYQANKPQAADQMSISQGDLQNNFLALKALVDVNHETFGSANEGKHAVVAFPEQVPSVVPPIFPPATTATELAMYAKADGGATHLFLRPTGKAAGDDADDINISEFIFTPMGVGTSSITFPNGLTMKWGSGNGTGTVNVAYAVAFTGIYTLQVTTKTVGGVSDNKAFAQIKSYDAAGFEIYCCRRDELHDPRNTDYTWFAVGWKV